MHLGNKGKKNIFKKYLIYRLWVQIKKKRKIQFVLLMLLMIIAAFAEVVSIGAIFPFLGVITSPDIIYKQKSINLLIDYFKIKNPNDLLLPITILFCMVSFFAGSIRLVLLLLSTRLSYATGADLSVEIYKKTLYQPYIVHVTRNSSQIISGITTKTNAVINQYVYPILNFISSLMIVIAIIATLMIVDPIITITAMSGFGIIYVIIVLMTRSTMSKNGSIIAAMYNVMIKSLQEGLGGIRDILIDGSQIVYCKIYKNADYSLRKAQAENIFIGGSPRFGMESLGMILIAIVAYIISSKSQGVSRTIPLLGALALGAQRLLPVLQQGYFSWTSIVGVKAILKDTIELLEQEMPNLNEYHNKELMHFNNEIKIKNLSFRYTSETPWVLDDINITIKKGSKIGFIGQTGSGKSTLLDIIMGLLDPTVGVICIDDNPISKNNYRSWQAHIAHVPQNIYLADSTLAENIAFGVEKNKINYDRVLDVIGKAMITETVEKMPQKINTFVGERGVRLSGGQRQRIGIARALYKESDVIIFDEATSALDSHTEDEVMKSIDGLKNKPTVLIIAHRLTTLKNCDMIIELENGKVKRQGSYKEIIESKIR